ncbi:tandem-95 repeat protein [uncultured Flavobacterium sp.]|uniref:tandem-95 repeat protein n=1 Tax=uncultured Flavobacterium sp. TaxID=165435 RepID=UPI003081B8D5
MRNITFRTPKFFRLIFIASLFLLNTTLSFAQVCGTPGADGPINVSTSINTYYPITGTLNLAKGAKTIALSAVPATDSHGNNFGGTQISSGDLILIIQMQDASIDYSNNPNYGSGSSSSGIDNLGGTGFTNLGNTGIYEYVIATSNVPLAGGTLTFIGTGTGGGALNDYFNAAPTTTSGKKTFQIIRVPQFSNLTLNSNITTPPFNGFAGGIIAFNVSGTFNFNGFNIDGSARGFRGGYSPVATTNANNSTIYVDNSTNSVVSGKGEGIAGTPRYMWDGFNQVNNGVEGMPGGSSGRGAPANAGGGGNDHNSGGGGGGNGGLGGLGGLGWQGGGGDVSPLNGGGRPGYTSYLTATPLLTRLVMGGGGGAGDANNAVNGVKGGVGGAIILINAGSIQGSGNIYANGGVGAAGTYSGAPDGAGGGGAGGSVFLNISNNSTTTINIEAKGGNGGNTLNDENNSHGPGGGGGGGIIRYNVPGSGVTINTSVINGTSGVTADNKNHGAQPGTVGYVSTFSSSDMPSELQINSNCLASLSTKVNSINKSVCNTIDATVTYEIEITNLGSGNAAQVNLNYLFPTGINFDSATATYTLNASGPTGSMANTGTANSPIVGGFNIPLNGVVKITLIGKVAAAMTPGTTYSSKAQALYLDPTRTIADPTRRITPLTNSFGTVNTTYQTGGGLNVAGTNFDGTSKTEDDVLVIASPGTPSISASGPLTFCTGGSVVLTSTAGTGYLWSTGATTQAITVTTSGTYTVKVSNASGCYSASSAGTTVTVNPLPTAYNVTGGGSYCAGGTGVAVTLSNSQTGVSYQLQLGGVNDGTAVAGTGSAISFGTKTAAGTYTVVATNTTTSCTAPMTGSRTISINPLPTAYTVTGGGTYCAGGTGFPVGLSNSQTGVSYQLQLGGVNNGTAVAGTTGSAISFGTKTAAGTYTVVATNTTTSCTASMTGNAVITVNPLPTAYTVTGGGSYCTGGTGLAVGLSNSQTGVSYQLQLGGVNNGTAVAGTTGSAINFGTKTAAGTYTVVATNTTTSCTAPMTGSVTITINPLPTAYAVTGGGTYCAGGTGVVVGLSNSQTGVSYQLQLAGANDGAAVAGTTGSAISFGTRTAAGTYTVVATNTTTSCTAPMTGSATITINPLPTAYTVTGGGAYCAGGAGFPVGLSNSQTGVSYQLQLGGVNDGTAVAGTTGTAISFGTKTAAGTYTVVATNTTTSCTAPMTGSATITINPLPTAYTVTGGGSYCTGGTGVAVGLSNSQTGVSYQLQLGGVNDGTAVAGTTGTAISFGTKTAAGTYTVVATNTTTSCTAPMTGSATITINPLPTAYTVTGGGSYCTGGTGVAVGLSNSQTGVSYQLQLGGVNDGTAVAGTTGTAISFGTKTAAGTYTVVATNTTTSCTASMTGNAVITVNPLPTAYNVTGGGSYCTGGTGVAVGLSNSQTGVSYQLQLGGVNDGTAVAGTTGTAISFGTKTAAGTYTVVATNTTTSCTAPMTGSATITINPLPTTYTVTGGGSYCTGGTGVAVGLSNSQTGVSYQLQLGGVNDGTAVAGTTGTAISFGTKTAAGTYTVVATNTTTSCTAPMTGSATITVNPLPTAYNVTGGGAYCAGGTGVAIGLSNSQTGVSYQLQLGGVNDGTAVAGTTGTAISFGTKTAAGTYTVVATNTTTSCTAPMTGSVTITVNPLPTAYTVTGGGTYCAGGTGVAIGLSNSQTGVSYQLQLGGVNDGTAVAGTTGTAISFGTKTAAGTYTVVATNTTTSCTAPMTGSATITINPLPTAYAVTGGGTYCAGGAGFSVGLSNSQTGVSYQLQLGGVNDGTAVAGTTGTAISFGTKTAAGTYTVVATNTTTSCTAPMTGSATITINPLPTTYTVTGGGSYCTGGTGVAVGLSNSQTGVSYQLQLGGVNDGTAVAGTTGTAISFGTKTAAGTYTVVATNTTTSCTAAMTGSAPITINPLPTAYNVTGGGTYCAGGTGVAVGLSNSQTGVSYQLQLAGANDGTAVAGTTGSAINFGTKTAAGTYTVVATNTTTSCTAPMTGSATITINPLPTAYAVTGGGSYCRGGTGVAVGLSNSQTGVSYQLQLGGVNDGTEVAGTTGSAINFGTKTAAGTYTVVATNTTTSCTAPMTGSVTITVNPLPTAYTVTGGGAYCTGGTGVAVGLSNSQTGVSYQLQLGGVNDGTAVAGTTGTAISFGTKTAAGTYTVVATNTTTSCTAPMTGSATITINPLPTAYAVTGGGTYCAGGAGFSVGLSNSQTGVSYQLQLGGVNDGTAVAGTTGTAISFGTKTAAGTYTVVATNTTTSCTAPMTGSATITINPLPTTYTVTGGGSYCTGGTGVAVGLSNSQTGVSYQLQLGGVNDGTAVAGTTGTAISFGTKTAAGTYTVVATNTTTSCTAAMTGSAPITINPLPTAYNVTGGGTYCAGGTGVAVGLSNSQTGVSYQLQLAGANDGTAVAGTTGSAINFGTKTAAGTYTVVATNTTTSCTAPMTGSATITINPLPTAYAVTGGGSYCRGGTGVAVGLSNSQTGVSYQLQLGGVNDGTEVAGTTGSAINFGTKTAAGTYTVVATNTTTSCTAPMTGSVTITVNPLPTAYTVTGGGAYCTGGTGVAVGLSNSQTGVSYQLQLGGVNDGTAVAGTTGTAISFGTKTAAGTYTVVATNTTTSCTAPMTGSATITINQLPAIPVTSVTQPNCNTFTGSITVTVQDPLETYSFDNGQNFQSGNSKSGLAPGSYDVIIKNTSGCNSPKNTVTINVKPNCPPVAVDDTATATEDTLYTSTVSLVANDTDVDSSPLTVVAGTFTTTKGGTLTLASDGSYTYIPAPNFNGTDTVDYTVTDGSLTDIGTLTITVNAVNDAPVATDDTATATEDTLYTSTVSLVANDTDVDSSPLTVVAGTYTTTKGGTLTLASDGSYTYMPAPNFNGTDTVDYTVTDGSLTDIGTLTITVNAVNDAPIAVDDTATATEDTLYTSSISLVANDTDVDSSPLTVVAGTFTTTKGGTLTLAADGSYTYMPAPNFNGTDTVDYTVTDGSLTDIGTLTITVNAVNDAPIAVDDTATATEDTLYTSTVSLVANDTDVDSSPLTVVAGTYTTAKGGTLTLAADGSYTYMPAPNFNGTDTVDYTVTDGSLTDIGTLTITVNAVNDAPIAVDDTATATEDTLYTSTVSLVVNDTDVDSSPLTVVAGTFTTTKGGTLTLAADGSYTYMPAPNFNGTDTVDYTVTDGSLTDIGTLTITVNAVNDAPVATDDTATATEDTLYTSTVSLVANDTDVDSSPLTVVAGTFTTTKGGTLTLAADGSYTYMPAPNFNGTDTVDYTVTDGSLTDIGTLTITVTAVNHAPVAVDNSNTTNEDTTLTVAVASSANLLANDTDVDGDTLTITQFVIGTTTYTVGSTANLAEGDLTINANGSYTFVPKPDYNGSVPKVTYTVTDGTSTATANLFITVTPVNDAPIAVDDTATATEDTLYTSTVSLVANDTDVDSSPLTVIAGTYTTTKGGTLTLAADGSYTYMPAPNFNGTDTVDYTVTDGSLTDIGTLTITVNAVNDAPIAVDDTATATEDTLYTSTVSLVANDTDVDSSPLTVVAGTYTTVKGGTLTLAADGSYTYMPAPNFNGTDTVDYTVTDGSLTDIGTLTITVNAVNHAPVAVDNSNTTNEDTTLTVAVASSANLLANDTDADGDTLTITQFVIGTTTYTVGSTTNLAEGDLTINANGSYTFVPKPDYNGSVPKVTYTVTDGTTSTTANLFITVTPVNDAPIAVDDTATATEDTLYTSTVSLVANDTDVDSSPLTVVAGTYTTTKGGTLTLASDGSYTYMPAPNFNGTDTVDYMVTDGSLTDIGTLTITVNAVNDAPIAVDDTVTATEDTLYTSTVSLVANDTDVDSSPLTVIAGTYTTVKGGTLTLAADGSYTYMPASNFNGTDTVDYTVTDGSLTDIGTLTITVTAVNHAPVAVDNSNTTNEDTTLTVAVSSSANLLANDTDADGDTLAITQFVIGTTTYTVGSTANLAEGDLTINANGSYTFVPKPDYNGSVPKVTYTVTDGTASTTANLFITVTPVNDAPIAVDDTATATEDTLYTSTVSLVANDTDVDSSPLTVVSGTFTTTKGGTLTLAADGSYTYMPAPNFSGIDTVDYTVTDGSLTDIGTLTITVTAVNHAPVAVDNSNTTNEDTTLTVAVASSANLLANDTDADGDTLTITQFVIGTTTYTVGSTANLAEGDLTINANGSYTFVPKADYNGSVPKVTYTVTDGTSSATANLFITVTPVNDAPIAVDDTATATEDTLYTSTVSLVANDTDVDSSPLTVVAGTYTTTKGGTLTLAADGSYTYMPAPNFNGTDTVDYTVTDGSLTDIGTLTITVNAVNDAPIAVDDTATATEDTLYTSTISLVANDTDVDSSPLTVVAGIYTTTKGGTLTLAADGSYTYMPAPNFNGTDSVDYTVTDGSLTDIGTLTITVTAVNHAPVAVDNSNTTNEDTTLTVAVASSANLLANDTDVDGDTLTITQFVIGTTTYTVGSTANLAEGDLTINANGSYTFVPKPDYNGSVPKVTYTVTDGTTSTTANLFITVTPVNDAPIAVDDTATATEDTLYISTVSLVANDTDVDSSPLTVIAGTYTTAKGGTLTLAADGSYTYMPAPNFNGTDTVDYTVTDGSLIDIGTLTITVTAVNHAPIAVDNSNTTNEDTTLTVDVTSGNNLLTNDTDADGDTLTITQFVIGTTTYTVGSTANLAEGDLTINANGSYTFVPKPDYNGSVPKVIYTVTDGTSSATANLFITVTPVNDAPIAVDNSNTTNEDTTLTVDVTSSANLLANDTDVDGDTLTITQFVIGTTTYTVGSTANLAEGDLTINANGSYTFVPKPDYNGSVSKVTYTVTDGTTSTTANLFITVIPVNDAIVIKDDTANSVVSTNQPKTILNVLGNDTKNGLPIVSTDVTIKETVSDPTGNIKLNPDGTIVLKPNAPSGTYELTYQVCELNTTNCGTATVKITVVAPVIDAVSETTTPINGNIGGTTISLITNDTLNGSSVVIGNQVGQVILTGINVPTGLTLNADGTVTVAPGTPKGDYQVKYRICEANDPNNCDTAISIIQVTGADLVLKDDTAGSVVSTNQPKTILNVLGNDTKNGQPIVSTDVTIKETVSDPTGNIKLNPDGTIVLKPNAPSGTYELTYQVCELNTTNCGTATVKITVVAPVIDAVSETTTPINGNIGGTTISLITNDTLNGGSVVIGNQVGQVILTGINVPTGLTLNADGTVTVAPGTPKGDYQVEYRICEANDPNNCDTAISIIQVTGADLVLKDDTVGSVVSTNQPKTILNVLGNDTKNGQPIVSTDVIIKETVSDPTGNIKLNPDGTIVLKPNAPSGTYELTYQVCELNTTNCGTATVKITVVAPVIDAVSETTAPINGNIGGTTISLITNDTLNGSSVVIGNQVGQVILTGINVPTGLTLNADGTVTVAPGTPKGDYQVEYRICEANDPNNCDRAISIIQVTGADLILKDDSAGSVVGVNHPVDVLNVLGNDTKNGQPIVATDVTIKETVSDPTGNIKLNPDGTIVLGPNAPAGTYELTYQVCELNTTNCATATVTVTVVAPTMTITADSYCSNDVPYVSYNVKPDNFTPNNLLTITWIDSANNVVATQTNLPLSGNILWPGATVDSNGNGLDWPGWVFANGQWTQGADGFENTRPSVTMEFSLNPTVKVVVNYPVATADCNARPAFIIKANDDEAGPINTNKEISTSLNIFNNDTLNGTKFNASNVVLTTIIPNPNLVLNADGSVDLVPKTPSGTYHLTYQICDAVNPRSCSQAVVTVTVLNSLDPDPPVVTPLILTNDKINVDGINGELEFINVLDNDLLNGLPIKIADVVFTPTTSPYFEFNSDGTVNVKPNTPGGDYTLTYQVCEKANPQNCKTGTLTVFVEVPSIAIIKTASFNDENGDKVAEAGESITYKFKITNTGNVALTQVMIKDLLPGIVISGQAIDLDPNESDETNFIAEYKITQNDINHGSVTNQASVEGKSGKGVVVGDTSDKENNAEDRPTVIALNGCEIKVFNAFSPNGDAKNARFYIQGLECYPENTVEIYNRWGVLVFDIDHYNNEDRVFVGISEGRTTIKQSDGLPVGTYFYILKYKDSGSNQHELSGYLYINK